MEAKEALERFLMKALFKKKERLLGFVSKPKTQPKFLNLIYHELDESLDDSFQVKSLDEEVLSMPGYKFEPPNNFGESISQMAEACDSFSDSYLVVSIDGNYAIYGPEHMIDERRFYAIVL